MHDNLYLVIIAAITFLSLMTMVVALVLRLSGGTRKNRQHLMQLGQEAQATVLSLQDRSGPGRGGAHHRLKLRLEVTPPGRPSYEARIVEYLPTAALPRVQPGMEVTVRYDPNRPKSVVLAGLDGAGEFGQAPAEYQVADDEIVFASDAGSSGPPAGHGKAVPGKVATLSTTGPLLLALLPMMALLLVAGAAAALYYSGVSTFVEETFTPLQEVQQDFSQAGSGSLFGSYELVEAAITDPFIPVDENFFRPEPGNRWLLITLSVRNTADKAINLNWSSMQLLADDGVAYSPVIFVESPLGFEARGLAPGARYTGDLIFEIPAGASPRALTDSYRDYEFELSAAAR